MVSDSLAIVTSAVRALPEHDGDQVQLGSRLKEDLGLDSMDVVDLCVALEDRLHITMDDQAVENIKTVSDLVEYLDKAPANKAAANG